MNIKIGKTQKISWKHSHRSAMRVFNRVALSGVALAVPNETAFKIFANFNRAKNKLLTQFLYSVKLLRKELSLLLTSEEHKAWLVSSRLKGLKLPANGLTEHDTPQPTTTLTTLRTSAAIFRRVGICA
ncbi:MAG: hypothetical protein EXR80_08390 [Methylococcales bacterium]|nr:hypothetical protein [Methylococcales bacterium]